MTWCFRHTQISSWLDLFSHRDECVHGFPPSHKLAVCRGSEYEDRVRWSVFFLQVPWHQGFRKH